MLVENIRKMKGQIEFVAIAAFVVLILIAVFFLLQPPGKQGDPWSGMLSDEQRLIRDSIKNFLHLATEEELTRLYEQGGFIDITGPVNIRFSGLEIPLWTSCGSINIPDVEYEMSRGINEYIIRNLEREAEFYGKDTSLDVSKLKTEVVLQNEKITVKIHLPATVRGFEMPPEYEIDVASNLKEILEFSEGLSYELNETHFLEMITLMSMVQSNRSNDAWTPVKGVITECGKRITVKRDHFLEATNRMISYTISHLVWNREAPRLAENIFFQLDSTGGKKYNLDISFHYPEEWADELPEKFATDPETLRIVAKPKIPLVPICYENYAVSYSFQYPVIVAVKDDIMNQYFRFAVYSSIKDNQPDTECEATLFDGRTDYEEKCIDNANCEFNIRVTDSGGNPIKGADVTFYECDLGYTNEAGVLASDTVKAPCMISELVVRKEGFMSSGTFITPDELTYYEVPLERIANPMKIRYYGIPMVGLNKDSEGKFENFIIIDQMRHINLVQEYFTDSIPLFKLETNLMMKSTEPNPFTEEDADFLITNIDDEDSLVHEKNETIIHPIQYEVSGLVSDFSRDVVTGYIEQTLNVREGVNELCVYFPVVVGDLSPPYTDIKTLDKSVRNDQSEDLKLKLQQAGLDYLIGECRPVILTACGDGHCQPTETCETGGDVKCPLSTPHEQLPVNTCRITCNYCGDSILDSGWEDCDFNEEKYLACDYNNPFECGLGTSEDNQYVCNSTCEHDEGWCGDGIVQNGTQYEGADDFGEQCDYGEDIDCCENCQWTCNSSSYETINLMFETGVEAFFSSGDSVNILFPTCRIFDPVSGGGQADTEEIVSAEKTAIVFVTDVSGSMNRNAQGVWVDYCRNNNPPWPVQYHCRINDAVRALLESFNTLYQATEDGADIHVGLVAFSSDVDFPPNGVKPVSIEDISSENPSHKGDLENEINSYNPDTGNTWTNNSIDKAAEMLTNYNADRKIIVLLSDGQPTNGYFPVSEATAAKIEGILIYTIAFTTDENLKHAMCDWSNESDCNCVESEDCTYAFSGINANDLYTQIINEILLKPEGDISVEIEGVTFDVPLTSTIDLDFSGVDCSDSEQTVNMKVEFDGGGELKLSNMRLKYCPACNPNS